MGCDVDDRAHIVDRVHFAEVLDGVRRLQPTSILSSHLPAAPGTSIERFLAILASVPDAEPAAGPSHEEFSYMLEVMRSMQAEVALT